MKTKLIYAIHGIIILAVAWGFGYTVARGQDGVSPAPQAPSGSPVTAFTYQGSLKQAGSAVNATCDFQFGLWTAQSLGTQLGVTQTLTSTVSGGLFSVELNNSSQFGLTPFDGSQRWIDVAVRCPSGSGGYPSLAPQALNPAPYALWSAEAENAATLNNQPASSYQQRVSGTCAVGSSIRAISPNGTVTCDTIGGYQGQVIVAKNGATYSSIQAALNSISDASDANRYLVRVMPGVYTETVTMKQYVDIEGSGELKTRITYHGSATSTTGTLVGANNAELRLLTVENTGGVGNNYAIAIYNSHATPRLTHVTAKASGGYTSYGVFNTFSAPVMTNVSASASGGVNSINYGVSNSYSWPVMTDVSVSASGGMPSTNYGVDNHYSSPVMRNVSVSASSATGGSDSLNCGMNNESSNPVIQNSTISATGGSYNWGIYNFSLEPTYNTYTVIVNNSQVTGSTFTIGNEMHFTTRVGASQLAGGAVIPNGGPLTCAGVYDESYIFYANSCP